MKAFNSFLFSTLALNVNTLVRALGTSCTAALSAPTNTGPYWYQSISHAGSYPYNPQGSSYVVYRNVKDYGAKGDGSTDDTAAINAAISAGSRCPMGGSCPSSSVSPAVVYFPSGTYIVSSALNMYYLTIMLGDAISPPTIKATSGFNGAAIFDSDLYIPNGNGATGYGDTNNFWRSVRNFVIDMTAIPSASLATGIHWQVAQATSLENIVINMSTASGTQHRGVYMENGSGGFLSDVTTNGGQYGLNVGSQQTTIRNINVNNAALGIYMNWNWGFTMHNITFSNCGIGYYLHTGGSVSAQGMGSVYILDHTVKNTAIFIQTATTQTNSLAGSIVIDNAALTGVNSAVIDVAGNVALAGPGSGSTTIGLWAQGNAYSGTNTAAVYTRGALPAYTKPTSLTTTGGKVFGRSRPQYDRYSPSQIVTVKSLGAKGDGVTDDTAALNAIFSAYAGCKIIYFDTGVYKITSTLKIPVGTIVVGEAWPVIVVSGSAFASQSTPTVAIQVGNSGDVGSVEIVGMIFSTAAGSAGAIILEWNVAEATQGSAGMWDTHFRIGGTLGSNLQITQCNEANNPSATSCSAAFMSMHMTPSSSGYFENVWIWTADHDVDDSAQRQIDVYSGRGLLVQSTGGPVWLWGTAVEHHVIYQYYLKGASNVFMGFIQTETPYYQPSPNSPTPFTQSSTYDPAAVNTEAWALAIESSSHIIVGGAGLYNFFQAYSQTCLNTNSCQSQIAYVDTVSSDVRVYNLNTVSTTNQLTVGSINVIVRSSNSNGFADTATFWVSTGTGSGSSSSSTTTTSKTSATSKTSSTTTTTSTAPTGTGDAACGAGGYNCGGTCYVPSTSGKCCSNGVLAASTGTCQCNGQVYSANNYVCDQNVLCPINTYSCGAACYSTSSYGCCNGALTPVGQGC